MTKRGWRMAILSVYQAARTSLRGVRRFVRKIPYLGVGRWCPVCSRRSRCFRRHRHFAESEVCVHCGAGARHRFFWLYVNARTDLFDDRTKRMLHVAPEACFVEPMRQLLGKGYVTADLADARTMIRMDITSIPFPDESFDVIYCSHVLEHVPDDRRAMREFCRVLKSSGWAILLVPISAPQTVEDPSVVDRAERLRLFGSEYHVRRYGPDYIDRLRQSGFEVKETNVADLIGEEEARRMGIGGSGAIYHCTK